MARYSKSSKGMKLQSGDIISVQGVKGKVQSVTVLKGENQVTGETLPVGVLVEADFTNGKDAATFLNFSEIEAVKHEGAWVNLKGEPVEV